MNRPTVCGALMVRDEARVIERALESVSGLDAIAVLDTGSEDSTPDLVRRFLDRRPAKWHSEGPLGEGRSIWCEGWAKKRSVLYDLLGWHAWEGWAESRNRLIELARNTGCDYALFLDADDQLELGDEWPEKATGYCVQLRLKWGAGNRNETSWRRIDLIKLSEPWHYTGDKHALICNHGKGPWPFIDWKIRVGNDGQRWQDPEKYSKGAAILKKQIVRGQATPRTWYYYAQDLKDAGRLAEALDAYERRLEFEGSKEERWHAAHVAAGLRQQLELNPVPAYHTAIRLAEVLPQPRAESLYELGIWFLRGNHILAAREMLQAAKAVPYPSQATGFIREDIYAWRIDVALKRAEMAMRGRS